MVKLLFSHFILLGLSLLFSIISIAKDNIKNTDMVIQQEARQEIDLVYYKVFPVHTFLRHTDVPGCTVKPVTGSIRNKKHYSVLICKEKVNLLRNKKTVALWQKENRLHGFILLDMSEMGLHYVKSHIIAVKRALKFNDNNISYLVNKQIKHYDSVRPVTGVFIRHVTNIRKYLLKNNRTGRIIAVNATPEHRFYVSNRQAFIPIAEVSPSDRLITDTGDEVRIIADVKGRERKQQNDKGHYSERLTTVYNLEVSEKHTYFVSDLRVFVHNPYEEKGIKLPEYGLIFKGDLINGTVLRGTFYRSDGTMMFNGRMKEQGFHQSGILFDKSGRRIYQGDWKAGTREGFGNSYAHEKFYWDYRERKLYEGYWKNDQPHGQGKLYQRHGWRDVVMFEGRFKDGDLVDGRHIGLDPVMEDTRLQRKKERQTLYIGEWFDGEHHGKGISFSYDLVGGCLESRGDFEHGKFMTGKVYDINQQLVAEYRDGSKIQ